MSKKLFANLKILITAGPTREYLDPVRFLSNPSSGKMGYALAAEAARRGARVTLVSGPASPSPQPSPQREREGICIIPIISAQDMYRAVMKHAPKSDVIIMAAAVSDYRPKKFSAQKVKKRPGPMTLTLVRTPDILATLGNRLSSRAKRGDLPGKLGGLPRSKAPRNDNRSHHDRPLLIGFAAETNHVVAHAQEKLTKKNLDLIVANAVNQKNSGFESDFNQVFLIDRQGKITKTPRLPKQKIARLIINMIERKLSKR